jgi:putative ABC transport system permease protein
MFRNYIKIALRILRKDKVHTAINISGLAIGLACCLLIMLFVRHEWSYDAFHDNADRIYRAWGKEDYGENEEFFYSITPIVLGPTLEEMFPEVEAMVRLTSLTDLVQRGEKAFTENVHLVDPDFFGVFSFALARGDAAQVLAQPNNVVLTPEVASRYFGEADPIGMELSIRIGGVFQEFVVTGIAEEPPTASSIHFDMVVPFSVSNQIYSETARQSWTNIYVETYVLLRDGTTGPALEAKLPTMLQQVLGERYGTYEHSIGLQPITDIHLNPDFPVGLEPTSDPAYSYILGAIAVFVLLIACINFTTLSIGRSMDRAREVGVRKVIGANRRQLMGQFWGEALLVTALALIVGIAVAAAALPLFNALSGRDLVLNFDVGTLLTVIALLAVIGLAAGSYPAVVLSGFLPVDVLKGKVRMRGDRNWVLRTLVVVQFMLSIVLIAATLITSGQLDHIQNVNLGFDRDRVVVIPTGVPVEEGLQLTERFRNELAGHDAIAGVTASAFPLDSAWGNAGYTDDNGAYRTFYFNFVDHDFVETMGMVIVSGRDFSRDVPADGRRALLVNESLVASYGWTDPIGQRLPGRNFPDHEIVGVVGDFNYQSLRNAVEPAVLVLDPAVLQAGIENVNVESSTRREIAVRLGPGEIREALDLLNRTWTAVAPNQEYDFYFLDAAVESQYRQDEQLGQTVGIASLLAIVIACMGLFGLAALAVVRRTKEIGVRRVLGASVPGLVALLSKDFAKLVLAAFLVAVPVTYFAMDAWLQDFAYRIDITWRFFLPAGLAAMVVALLTVSYQAIKAALGDPIKRLRYE